MEFCISFLRFLMLIIVMNEVTITEIDFSYRSLLKIFNKQGKEGGKSSHFAAWVPILTPRSPAGSHWTMEARVGLATG